MTGEVPLRGWKEIAARLGVSERTVRRWEETRGLPVHRLAGTARDAVLASPSELKRWMSAESQRGFESLEKAAPKEEPSHSQSTPRLPPSSTEAGTGRRLGRQGVLLFVGSLVFALVGFLWLGGNGGSPSDALPSAEFVLLVIEPGGTKTKIVVPAGDAGRLSGPGGRPALLLRPRLIEGGRRAEVEIVTERAASPSRPPLVVRLDPGVQVQVLEPFQFGLEWSAQ